MATVDTGWVSVNTGDNTQLIVPFGVVISAQVRWQGVSTTQSSYNQVTRSGSGTGGYITISEITTPSVPSGYSFGCHTAYGSVTSSSCGDWHVSLWSIGGFKSGTCNGGSVDYVNWSDWSGRTFNYSAAHASNYDYYFEVRTYGIKTVNTASPKVTISSVTITGPSSLTDGQVSNWYTIPPHLLKRGLNTISHTVSGSGKAKVQLLVVHLAAGQIAASTVNIF